jgi:hypothetical protein
MRAKMNVWQIESFGGSENSSTTLERLTLKAVAKSGSYPSDGSDEDNSFARWTPNAEMTITISNPDLFGKFSVGQAFYVDFTEVK